MKTWSCTVFALTVTVNDTICLQIEIKSNDCMNFSIHIYSLLSEMLIHDIEHFKSVKERLFK
jgi:hypothetical protein